MSETRKCQTCDRLVKKPARKCDVCKSRRRRAARAGRGSRSFTRSASAVLCSTSPVTASSSIVANGDYYRDRAEQRDGDCARCGGPHQTEPEAATDIDVWHEAMSQSAELAALEGVTAARIQDATCKFCGLTPCPFGCAAARWLDE